MKVKLLTTFLTTKKWNKAPCRTFFRFAGKGIKKRGGLKPSSGIRAITSLFPTLFLRTSCQLLQKRLILCYGFDCPNISGEWERNDNWMADRLNPFNGIVHTFPTECKGKRKEGVKADSSEICSTFKNKPIPKQSKNYCLVEKCSIFLFESDSFWFFKEIFFKNYSLPLESCS